MQSYQLYQLYQPRNIDAENASQPSILQRHARSARPVASVRRTGRTLMAAWLLILGVYGGTCQLSHAMMGGWFSSQPEEFPGRGPGILLEARWMKEFGQESQSPLTFFLNRGAQSIVSTNHSAYAFDMLTGEILWQSDEISGLSLHPLSDETTLPLLGLLQNEGSETTLIRFNPENGHILWQQDLPESDPLIRFDARHIAVLSHSHVSLYDVTGVQLWTQTFHDGVPPQTIGFHDGLLIGRYSGETTHLTYLNRENGDILWEQKERDILPGYVIPESNRQIFYTKENAALLMDVRRGKTLWDSPQELGHVIGHSVNRQSGRVSLLCTKGVAHQQDGKMLFSYPSGFRVAAVSDEYLILLQGSAGQQNTCLLLDKSSGKTVQQFYKRKWFAMFYVNEDKDALYLAANSSSPVGSRDTSIETALLRFDKQSLTVKEIPVGRNIGTIRFKVFPQEKLVFIPSYQRIGGYLLPEM